MSRPHEKQVSQAGIIQSQSNQSKSIKSVKELTLVTEYGRPMISINSWHGVIVASVFYSQEVDSGARARSRIPQQPNRLSPTRMSLPPAALTRSSDREKATDDESRPGYVPLFIDH